MEAYSKDVLAVDPLDDMSVMLTRDRRNGRPPRIKNKQTNGDTVSVNSSDHSSPCWSRTSIVAARMLLFEPNNSSLFLQFPLQQRQKYTELFHRMNAELHRIDAACSSYTTINTGPK